MTYHLYTVKQLVEVLISNGKSVIEFPLQEMFKIVLIYSIYGGMATLNELVNEFYLYCSR